MLDATKKEITGISDKRRNAANAADGTPSLV